MEQSEKNFTFRLSLNRGATTCLPVSHNYTAVGTSNLPVSQN